MLRISATSSLEESSYPVLRQSSKQCLMQKSSLLNNNNNFSGTVNHNGNVISENFQYDKLNNIPSSILLTPEDQTVIDQRNDNYKSKTISLTTNTESNEVSEKQNSISAIAHEVTPKTRVLRRRPPSSNNSYVHKSVQDWAFINDSQGELFLLSEKLVIAQKKNHFSLQLKAGREIDVVLNTLQDRKKNLGECAIKDLKDEIDKTIGKVVNSEIYIDYIASQEALVHKYKGNKFSNQTIVENIEKLSKKMILPFEATNQNKLRQEKEEYIEALLYRIIQSCEKSQGLFTKDQKALLATLRGCKDRLYMLLQDARAFNMAEEQVDYFDRLISALVTWKNKSYRHSSSALVNSSEYPLKRSIETLNDTGKDPIPRYTTRSNDKADKILAEEKSSHTLISDIQNLIAALESDLLSLLENKCKVYHNKHQELIQVHKILLEGVDQPIKYIPTQDGSSICKSPRPKRHITKRTGSSEAAKETVKIIIKKLEQTELVFAPTNKLVQEIIDVMTKSPWIRAILTHHDDLLSTLLDIRKDVTDRIQNLEYDKDYVWRLLLDPTSNQTFQKYFMLTYRNTIDGMTHEIGYPAEKLFKIFNLQFGVSGPYQRKQILLLVREWLCSPTFHLKSTERDILEFERALVEINQLAEQARNSKNSELIDLVKDFDILMLNYLKPEFKPLSALGRPSPEQLMEDVAMGNYLPNHYKHVVKSFSDTLKTMSLHHFLQINSSEWTDKDFSSKTAPHIRELINYSTNLSLWVEVMLSMKNDTKPKEHLIEFFINIMDQLTDEHTSTPSSPLDYLSAMAIFAELTKSNIEPLFFGKHPKLKISQKHLAKYKELSSLFDFNGNFGKLRQKHKEAHYFVPFMGVLVKDFTINLDFKKIFTNSSLNISALESIGNTADIIYALQSKLEYTPEKAHFNLDDDFARVKQIKRGKSRIVKLT